MIDIIDCEKFNDTMSAMIDKIMTSSIKSVIARRQKALHESGKNSDIYKYWRNKVQSSIKAARKKYYVGSVRKLKISNPVRWWKEVKALGGLSSKSSWYSQLLSDDFRNCEDLAETFNSFLVALTSHFDPLPPDDNMLVYKYQVNISLTPNRSTRNFVKSKLQSLQVQICFQIKF